MVLNKTAGLKLRYRKLINVFKKILIRLVLDAEKVESKSEENGFYWEIKLTDEQMEKIAKEINADD